MPAQVRTEQVSACPVCGDRRARALCRARDRLHGGSQQFIYAACSTCAAVYQSLRPLEAEISAFYPDDYGPYQSSVASVRRDGPAPAQGPHRPLQAGFLKRAARRTLRLAERCNRALARRRPDPLPAALAQFYTPDRPGKLLFDFGCGSEAFLNQARAQGWDTLGADFAPGAVAAAQRAGHRALLVDDRLWNAMADGSVAVVRMNHVLEHLYQPHAVMASLRRKLEPGGRLHLATPNASCLTFRLLRTRWFSLDCPRHIVLYSPANVRRLLLQAGFKDVAVYQEVLTKDMARSLGYVLQDFGTLTTDGVSGLPARPGLAALLFAPARLAALAGMSDRMHVIAQV